MCETKETERGLVARALDDILNRYLRYYNAEKQGLLLFIPCKEIIESSGDTVYYLFEEDIVECISCGVTIDFNGKLWLELICDKNIFPYRVPCAEFDTEPSDWCGTHTRLELSEWNKMVFKYKEQAELMRKDSC